VASKISEIPKAPARSVLRHSEVAKPGRPGMVAAWTNPLSFEGFKGPCRIQAT
jgi:hypothetical protein